MYAKYPKDGQNCIVQTPHGERKARWSTANHLFFFTDCTHPQQNVICNEDTCLSWEPNEALNLQSQMFVNNTQVLGNMQSQTFDLGPLGSLFGVLTSLTFASGNLTDAPAKPLDVIDVPFKEK